MVDETLILRKLGELDEYCRQIKEYSKINESLKQITQFKGIQARLPFVIEIK